MLFIQVFVLLLVHTAAGQSLPPFCTSTTPIPINEVCSTLGLTNDPAACPGGWEGFEQLLLQLAQVVHWLPGLSVLLS